MFKKLKDKPYKCRTLLVRLEEIIKLGYITKKTKQLSAGQYPTNSYSVTESGIDHLVKNARAARSKMIKTKLNKKTPLNPIAEPISPGQKKSKPFDSVSNIGPSKTITKFFLQCVL